MEVMLEKLTLFVNLCVCVLLHIGVSYKAHFQQGGRTGEDKDDEGSTHTHNTHKKSSLFGDHERGECFRHDPSLLDDPDMTQGVWEEEEVQ